MNKRNISIIAFLIVSGITFSQVPFVADHYIFNPLLISPSYAGSREALNITAFYHRQWAGINGAPESLMLTADAPFFENKAGIAISIYHDRIGVTNENAFSFSYAYRIRTETGNLSMGLRAGILSSNNKWSDLIILDPGDEQYLRDSRSYVMPDFGFGMHFMNNNYFAGISIPRLVSYDFNHRLMRYSMNFNPKNYYYLLNSGASFDLVSGIRFLPSVMLGIYPPTKALLDLNACFSFSDKLWLGTTLRSNGSFSGFFQFAINRQLKTAYTYFYDFSRLGKLSNGSHEIMIRYEFAFRSDAVNPLIF